VGPPIAAPPSFPTPLAPRAAHVRAGRTDPRRPTYGVVAVPWACCAPYRDPQSWHARQHHHLCLPTKVGRLFLARRAPLHSRRRHHGRPRRAQPSGCRRRQTVLLLPPLGLPVAPTLACCLGQVAGLPESNLQRPPRRPPPCPPAGHLSATSEHPNRSLTTPRGSPTTPRPSSPARTPGFSLVVLPQAPRATLQGPR
jgi:hypothetical protein